VSVPEDATPRGGKALARDVGRHDGGDSGCNSDLEHAVALVPEQIVSGLDLVRLEAVRNQRPEIGANRLRSQPP
jgi:hypothetical protein